MNRDEKRDRLAALAPAVFKSGSHRAVFPREPAGGTWISVNDAGVCLALINWHRVEKEGADSLLVAEGSDPGHFAMEKDQFQPRSTPAATEAFVSRGQVVRELAAKSTADEIVAALRELPLRKLRPFRLIAIFPVKTRVTEWRWNLQRLARRDHEWRRQHWFSSGFDERAAERVRAKICASFVVPLQRDDPGSRKTSRRSERAGVDGASYSLKWLRELHRSHAPKRGPFSICMHRPDAATVSYTEVSVSKQRATMRYRLGPACRATRTTATTLPVTSTIIGKLRL